ncbi:sushi, von Willebrand factor type A, EGF and pentraxin domain-containing protein 1-like isoform X2 [Glandiceps talaboti]
MVPLKHILRYRLVLLILIGMDGLLYPQARTDLAMPIAFLRFYGKLQPYKSTATELVFVVDSSSSIGSTNFQSEINFLKHLATLLSISTTDVHPAVVTISNTTEVIRNIDYISNPNDKNKCTFIEELDSCEYIIGHDSEITCALEEALEILKDSRQDAKRLIILLTNGSGRVCPRVFGAVLDELKREYIYIFAVALGSLNRPRLEEIATKENVFTLNQISEDIANLARDTKDDSSTLQLLPGSDACDCDSESTCACGTRSGEYMCACNPGHKVVNSECEACPLHTYSEVYNAVECSACPGNSETNNIASTSMDQCECIAGYQKSGGECVAADCKTLPSVTQATSTCPVPKLHNEICTFTCNTGYYTSEGSQTVTSTCINGSWNVDSIVCIEDEPPNIACPEDFSKATAIENIPVAVNWDEPVYSDTIDGTNVDITQTHTSGSLFDIGTATVIYTATDQNGNSASCSFTVTIVEDEPPNIACPEDYSKTTAIENIPVAVNWDEPVYSDTIDGTNVDITQTHTSGSLFDIGTTTVIYTATDQNGNSAPCSFTVTIVDLKCEVHEIENGAVACTTWDVGIGCDDTDLSGSQICLLLCQDPYDFDKTPASLYRCHWKGKWALEPCHGYGVNPDPSNGYENWPNCEKVGDITDLKGNVTYQYYVNACTTSDGSQEIREIFVNFMKEITHDIAGGTFCKDETICNVEAVDYYCGPTTGKRSLDTVLRFTIPLEVERIQSVVDIGGPDPVEVMDKLITYLNAEVDEFIKDIDGITILGAETPEVNIDVDCRRRSMLQNDKCLICGGGSYYDKTIGECQECAKGYFQHEDASTSCRQCPIGTTTDNAGSNSISHCKAEKSDYECSMPSDPVDGSVLCETSTQLVCHVQCRQGFNFAREPADRYICDYSGGWRTEPVDMDELIPNCGESSLVEVARKSIKVDFYHTDCDDNKIKKVQNKFKKTFTKSFLKNQCIPGTICDINGVSAECTALNKTKTIDGVEYNVKIDITFYIYGNIKNPSNDENVHAAKIAATKTVLDDRAADFENMVNLGQFIVKLTKETLLIVKSNSYIGLSTVEFCVRGSFLKGNKCVTCPVGTFGSETYCEPCPVGTYQDEDGQIECKDCPDGQTTSGRQTSSLGECIADN